MGRRGRARGDCAADRAAPRPGTGAMLAIEQHEGGPREELSLVWRALRHGRALLPAGRDTPGELAQPRQRGRRGRSRSVPRHRAARADPGRSPDRDRIDGAGVPRLPGRHRARRGGEGAAPRAQRQRRAGGALPPRGQGREPPRAPERGAGADDGGAAAERRRAHRGRALPGDGVPRRHLAPLGARRGGDERGGSGAPAGARAPHHAPALRRRRRGAHAGHRPPRHQARERDARAPRRRRRLREGARLRHRAPRLGSSRDGDAGGADLRDGQVHFPRGGGGAPGGPARGRLLDRDHALSDARGAHAVRRRLAGGAARPAHPRAPGGAAHDRTGELRARSARRRDHGEPREEAGPARAERAGPGAGSGGGGARERALSGGDRRPVVDALLVAGEPGRGQARVKGADARARALRRAGGQDRGRRRPVGHGGRGRGAAAGQRDAGADALLGADDRGARPEHHGRVSRAAESRPPRDAASAHGHRRAAHERAR